jgi:D-galactarolactone cycloisomerase
VSAIVKTITHIGLAFELGDKRAYGNARGLRTARAISLIVVETRDGTLGIGEAWGPPRPTAAHLDVIRPYFVGASVHDRELVRQRILDVLYHQGVENPMMAALSGIDMALHDIAGKEAGLALCRLIGGRGADSVPVYASTGYFTASPKRGLERQIKAMADKGFGALKIKIGRNAADDETRVKAVRRLLGPNVTLMVDANAAYRTDQALESMARIAPQRIHWYEEPVAPWDFAGYSELRGRAAMRISGGEALYGARTLKRFIDERCVDVVQPDLTMCGGLDEGTLVAKLAGLAGIGVTPHVWGGAVGLAAAIHFAAATPELPSTAYAAHPNYLEFDLSENPLRDAILSEPIVAAKGMVAVPAGPGLGIELDWKVVERYRVK